MQVEAVIFDFGRVISAPKPAALFRRYEDELGLKPGSINAVMFQSRAWEQALVGEKTMEEFWYAVGPALGLNSPRQIDAFRSRYYRDEAVNPGVLRIIQSLQGRYKLAVLSNSPPGLAHWLADWQMLHLFDEVFCSGDEGMAKPAPAVFAETLRRLAVAPEQAVFIDDTREHVNAARSQGLQAIHFSDGDTLAVELTALLGIVER